MVERLDAWVRLLTRLIVLVLLLLVLAIVVRFLFSLPGEVETTPIEVVLTPPALLTPVPTP